MPIKNIAIACQGGGSHAAYAAGALPVLLPKCVNVAVASSGVRNVQGAGGDEQLHLTGISGTSGGAISALLGWYGFLTGGPAAANARLGAFWESNCARQPGERLVNDTALRLGGMMNYDLKFSPYLSPLREVESMLTRTWPMLARFWPPLAQWARGDYFELRELIKPHVDFELVGALGEFSSVPLEIKRWGACDLEARMFDGSAARQASIGQEQRAIEDRIRSRLGAAGWIASWITRNKLAPDALLRVVFDSWSEPDYRFEQASLEKLSEAIQDAMFSIPQLLVGAVEVDTGAFRAFSSERAPEDGGITLDAILASAALPWLFEAPVIASTDPETRVAAKHPYWDGLFSQNPPIKNFISGLADRRKKPDGLWVLQINQDQYDFDKHIGDADASAAFGGEIWHRRDSLSGNLSLNQEIAFIEAINRRLDDPDQASGERDKPIEVARIVMDGAAVASAVGRELGAFSKMDRDPALKDALLEHGRAQARHFLSLRGDANRLCDELAYRLEAIGARPTVEPLDAHGRQPGAQRIFGGFLAPDVLTLERAPANGNADGGRSAATLRWHLNEAVVDDHAMRIQGTTRLWVDEAGWRLGETTLVNVEQRQQKPLVQPALPELEAPSGLQVSPPIAVAERSRAGRKTGARPPH
jgi:predicted acylesterase/phospholipase RssA